MGMTITERILASHSGRSKVAPGENVWCSVDVLLTHDICGPGTIGVFHEQFGADAKVLDPDGIVIIPDHYIFTADAKSHRNVEMLREFAAAQGIRHYYDADFIQPGLEGVPPAYADPESTPYRGVCHVALPQEGHARPGEILLGTDSHTCTHGAFGAFATGIGNTEAAFVMGTGKLWLKVPPSLRFAFDGEMPDYLMAKDLILHLIGQIGTEGAGYCAMEFVGEAIAAMDMYERMTLCNMAIEAGGKNGIIAPDSVTLNYLRARTNKPLDVRDSDGDARYAKAMEFDVSAIEPTVARPHSPGNCCPARELGDVKIDRAYIGSCTGGKMTDLLAAARVLAGRTVQVETYVVPATTEVDAELDRRTIGPRTVREVLLQAGCKLAPASCAACLGGPPDTFGRVNEAISVISTTNRNFPGRMGHKEAGIYLVSPMTAAATALTGRITDPRDVLEASPAADVASV
ncbi:MAG TPA: 3-isopropylmalate dehydratase large subunit [Phycisphaerae bacterium]|nr:3-isopropylmalate dehydratase large subunit [Phycisphaerae bacterium]